LEPGVPLVAAPGSGSRWGGQALQIRVRAGCGGAWLASVTVGVYEAVSIVGVTVRAGYRDLGVDGRGAGVAEPRLPLVGGVGRLVVVEQVVLAERAPAALGA